MEKAYYGIIGLSLLMGLIILTFVTYQAYGELISLEEICMVTLEYPYYDCDSKIYIFVTDEIPHSICDMFDEPAFACMWHYPINVIFMPYFNQYDQCGRTTLHHELLHFLYPYNALEIDNNVGKRCELWQ